MYDFHMDYVRRVFQNHEEGFVYERAAVDGPFHDTFETPHDLRSKRSWGDNSNNFKDDMEKETQRQTFTLDDLL